MSAFAEQRAVGIFAGLLESIVTGESTGAVLAHLTRCCVELVDVSSAGIIVADPRGGLRMLAASDEQGGLAELFQTHHGEGPALDVVTSGNALSADFDASDDRWPLFAPAARELGFAQVVALPIRLDGETLGALNLFRGRPPARTPPLSGPDTVAAQALSDLTSLVLAQERPDRRTERMAEAVPGVLNDRGRIEQAKGALAAHLRTTPELAHGALAHLARVRGAAPADVARGILVGDTTLVGEAAAWARSSLGGEAPNR